MHGDYRIDNMILQPSESKVLAVLDWELSTLGHPLGDFTYHLMQWFMPEVEDGAGTQSLANADYKELGIPDADDYVKMYSEKIEIDLSEEWDLYSAYNLFKLAGILQGILGRVRDGTAAHENAAERASGVRNLSDKAWDLVEKNFL